MSMSPEAFHVMLEVQQVTVGAGVAMFLERCGVRAAFGVISIHNMPILDALATRGRIRFVMARGEAGATGMADACARSTGSLGVCFTSTGTAAGNAAGALVEALTAGTPLLHITGQIESRYLDQDLAYIHEAPDQLTMLRAVSKRAFRVRSAATAIGVLKQAVQCAMTAPTGPVSIEIPIDIQEAPISLPGDLQPLPVAVAVPSSKALDAVADRLATARRPMLWLGGGARNAGAAVARLMSMGFGVVSSTQGRGIVAEDDPRTLGAYNLQKPVEAFYETCDAMLVVGSRLRGNETLKYALKLPQPLYRIDADPSADGRGYGNAAFVCSDAGLALDGLADRLEGRMKIDRDFMADLRATRAAAERQLLDGLGPYAELVSQLQRSAGRVFNWVRDVTVSNSTWGNRQMQLFDARAGVHATGGGIGQGLAMAVGAAVGSAVATAGKPARATTRKTFCLSGDGGFILNLGELATAVQETLRHRFRADERSALWRDPEHPGRAVRRSPLLRRTAYARLWAALGVARRRPCTGGRHGRSAGGTRPRRLGDRTLHRRDRHAFDRRVQDGVRRPADETATGCRTMKASGQCCT